MSGFDAYGAAQGGDNSGKKIDWNELNKAVVEQAGLQQRETLVGYVSMIVDLGTQEQPDAEFIFTGDEEDEAKAIEDKPNTYFKDGIDPGTKKTVRFKCWPNKPVQCVAVAVDFPDIIVDKGQFFGDSKPLPLRLWLGGEFYIHEKGMVVARPTTLKVNKKLGEWSFDQKHLLHKMAVAAKLVGPNEAFLPQQIDKLLGQAFQFDAQVFLRESKGKKYYNEYIKFVSGLGRGMQAPEQLTTPKMVQFNIENDEGAVKEIRNHVLNTIKGADNYEGSMLQKQVEKVKGERAAQSNTGSEEKAEPAKEKKEAPKKTAEQVKEEIPPVGDEDDDLEGLPF